MGQHILKTTCNLSDKPITVLMGYEHPMGGYFMVIEYDYQEDEDEFSHEFIFSNLDEKVSYPDNIDGYLIKLGELGIDIPDVMLANVIEDKRIHKKVDMHYVNDK